MKAIYRYKDGRTAPVPQTSVGALRIHVPHKGPNGTSLETIFLCQEGPVGDVLEYVEQETVDITERMQKAHEENELRRWQVISAGLNSSDCEVRFCECPCHRSTSARNE
jgi:hypothetical protein